MNNTAMSGRKRQTTNSALWAAYGDALGFMTELADEDRLQHRTGLRRVTETKRWQRRIGGRFGANVRLPAGCYSDDTQLRLATSRAIRQDGQFDVEAFANVELPIWLNYSLGAGLGTTAAAKSLRKGEVDWYNNFFESKRRNYFSAGGNGAAMRIQPHVWSAARVSDFDSFMTDVVRNAVCTHGHPRGIFGAVFHAFCLALSLQRASVPEPYHWDEAVEYFRQIPNLVRRDNELKTFWLPAWSKKIGMSMDEAVAKIQEECTDDISVVKRFLNNRSEGSYSALVKRIGGMEKATRGSGTKTAIIASALSWLYRSDETPEQALEVAVNRLGSDTDTIATMTGALMGASSTEEPAGELLDSPYIEREALRNYEVAMGTTRQEFEYPDLINWQLPDAQADAIETINGRFCVRGLGLGEGEGEVYESRSKNNTVWQVIKLRIGQSLIAKRREQPREVKDQCLAGGYVNRAVHQQSELFDSGNEEGRLAKKGDDSSGSSDTEHEHQQSRTINALTNQAIQSGFDPAIIGRHILRLIEGGTIEKPVSYVSIIAKAKLSRDRKDDRS